MKYLKYFRLTFVVFTLAFMAVAGKASLDSYENLNSVVKNETGARWRFGYDSMVKGETKEVLFKGSLSLFSLGAGESFPMGRDERRDRIIGVYLEGMKKQLEISCPQGFSFYTVEIHEDSSRCVGSNSKISRWMADAPYTPYFIGYYLSIAKDLLMPENT